MSARVLEECKKRYPAIEEEVLAFSDENRRGVVAFLLDTLIDVRALGFSDGENVDSEVPNSDGLTDVESDNEEVPEVNPVRFLVRDGRFASRGGPLRRSSSFLTRALSSEHIISRLHRSLGVPTQAWVDPAEGGRATR